MKTVGVNAYHTFPNAAERCSVCGVWAKSAEATTPTCNKVIQTALESCNQLNKKEPRVICASDAQTLDALAECRDLGVPALQYPDGRWCVQKANRTGHGETLPEALTMYKQVTGSCNNVCDRVADRGDRMLDSGPDGTEETPRQKLKRGLEQARARVEAWPPDVKLAISTSPSKEVAKDSEAPWQDVMARVFPRPAPSIEDGWYRVRPKYSAETTNAKFVNGFCIGGFPASDYEILDRLPDDLQDETYVRV